jgi:cell volume regulation protein A
VSIHDTAVLLLALGGVAAAALLGARIAQALEVPSPLIFLVGGFALGYWVDTVHDAVHPNDLSIYGTVALVLILVDGGLRSGVGPFREELVPILGLGLAGTLATFGLVSVAAHSLIGLNWDSSLILGAAVAPTDPAAVFSVLAQGIPGAPRAATVLEGEAGLNDPVAIALVIEVVDAVQAGRHASVIVVARRLVQEGVIGAVVGIVLALVMGRILGPSRPSPGVAPALSVLAMAFVTYGFASVLGGSGFLAAYLYGLMLGDRQDLFRRDAISELHDQLASLAEISMFVVLGVGLAQVNLTRNEADALLIGLLLVVVIRPLVVSPLLALGFDSQETALLAVGGLKGAVPIVLGSLPLAAGISDGPTLFAEAGLITVVSLAVQGVPLPRIVRLLGLDRPREPDIVGEPLYHGPPTMTERRDHRE